MPVWLALPIIAVSSMLPRSNDLVCLTIGLDSLLSELRDLCVCLGAWSVRTPCSQTRISLTDIATQAVLRIPFN